MLPDLRFVIGAGLALALLVVTGFGVAATLRFAHQAKMGPLEASRSLAYAGQTDWNQFQNPSATRRFENIENIVRPAASDSVLRSLVPPAGVDADAPPPVAPSSLLEALEPGPAGDLPDPTVAAGAGQDANSTPRAAQDGLMAASVPHDGDVPPGGDDPATPVDLDSVIGPAAAASAPLSDAATAAKPIEKFPVEFAAVASPAILPASSDPEHARPEPSPESERVANIPATLPRDITAVEPRPPLANTAPARRAAAKAAPQAKRTVRRSRPSVARARTIRAAPAHIAGARPAAQQPAAPPVFAPATSWPNNAFYSRQYNINGFNNTGFYNGSFNTNRPAGSPSGN